LAFDTVSNPASPTANLIRVDVETGDRTLITQSGDGNGADFEPGPFHIARESNGDILVYGFTPNYAGWIHRVDVDTGHRSVVSNEFVGTGPILFPAAGMEIDPISGDIVVCVSATSGGLICVDPTTGDREWLAGNGIGTGPFAPELVCLDFAPSGNVIAYNDDPQAIVEFDAATWDWNYLSINPLDPGPQIDNIWDLGVMPNGTALVAHSVYSDGLEIIVAIDPVTGERREVSSSNVGSGLLFSTNTMIRFLAVPRASNFTSVYGWDLYR
jgi:hypothetical protein